MMDHGITRRFLNCSRCHAPDPCVPSTVCPRVVETEDRIQHEGVLQALQALDAGSRADATNIESFTCIWDRAQI